MDDSVELPGFGYSPSRAAAIAAAVESTLAYARFPDVQVADIMAGLAEVIAREVARRPLRRNPGKAAAAVGAYIIRAIERHVAAEATQAKP